MTWAFTFFNRLFDGAPEVAAAHAVLDGDVALVILAIDFGPPSTSVIVAQLCKRNAFAGRRQKADVLDGFLRCRGTGEDSAARGRSAASPCSTWRQRVAANGGLDSILHVGDINLVARRLRRDPR